MNPIDNCEHYAKLEDNTAEIGIDYTDTGISYEACKFNNGGRFSVYGRHLTVANAISTIDRFIFTGWVNTSWAAPGVGGSYCLFSWRHDANNRLYMYTVGDGRIGLEGKFGGIDFGYYTTEITWDALTNTFVMVVVDKDGINGNTIRYYVDTVLKYSSNVALPTPASNSGDFRLGALDLGYGFDWRGLIDDAKLFFNPSQELINAINLTYLEEGFPTEGKIFRPGVMNYINNFPFNRPLSRVA